MKASKYNHSFQTEDGTWLLFNQMSKALATVTADDLPNVTAILASPIRGEDHPDLRDRLVEGQFLIEDHIDEQKLLRVLHQQERFDSQRLHLVLFPTFNCDFSCSYCFQRQLSHLGYDFHGEMSAPVADALINYVRKAVPHLQRFTADWMGGEPLTSLDTVLRMSHAFKSLCEDELCAYRSQITTKWQRHLPANPEEPHYCC